MSSRDMVYCNGNANDLLHLVYETASNLSTLFL